MQSRHLNLFVTKFTECGWAITDLNAFSFPLWGHLVSHQEAPGSEKKEGVFLGPLLPLLYCHPLPESVTFQLEVACPTWTSQRGHWGKWTRVGRFLPHTTGWTHCKFPFFALLLAPYSLPSSWDYVCFKCNSLYKNKYFLVKKNLFFSLLANDPKPWETIITPVFFWYLIARSSTNPVHSTCKICPEGGSSAHLHHCHFRTVLYCCDSCNRLLAGLPVSSLDLSHPLPSFLNSGAPGVPKTEVRTFAPVPATVPHVTTILQGHDAL